MKLILNPKPPYDFDLTWRFHFDSRPQPETYIDGIWRRAIRINQKNVPIRVKSIGSVKKPKLLVEIPVNLTIKERREIKKLLDRIFNVNHNLPAIYKVMEVDPKLKEVKDKLCGLTTPHLSISIFEGVVKAILQQQLALNVAFMMTELLIRNFGECVKIGKEEFWEFPSPEKLAKTKLQELRKKCKLSQRKAEYIWDFSNNIVGGYDPERFWNKSSEKVIEELTKFRGIGRWTAEMILVATMKRPYVIPGADLGVRRVIGKKYLNRLATEEEVRRISKKWNEFADYISFYLICEEHYDKGK